MTASKPIFLYTKLLWTIVQVVERPMNILENDFDRFIAWARLSFIYETTAHSSHVLSVAVISVLLKWCYYTRIGFNNNRNNNKDQKDINKYNNFIRVDDLAKMPPPYFSALYTNTSLYSYSFFWTVFVSQLHFPSARIPSASLLVGPQTTAAGVVPVDDDSWCYWRLVYVIKSRSVLERNNALHSGDFQRCSSFSPFSSCETPDAFLQCCHVGSLYRDGAGWGDVGDQRPAKDIGTEKH